MAANVITRLRRTPTTAHSHLASEPHFSFCKEMHLPRSHSLHFRIINNPISSSCHDLPCLCLLFSVYLTSSPRILWTTSLTRRTVSLLELWQCQSQAWAKREGVDNGLCYHTMSLN